MKENLSLKERLEYSKVVNRARKDPIFYMREILGWKSMWKVQEEIIRTFYQAKYDPNAQVIKELAWISGQRSGKSVVVGNIASYEFFEIASLASPSEYYGLMQNQPLAISCVAAGKEQALDGIFSLMRNSMENSEWINQWWDLKYSEGRVEFKDKHIFAQVKAARADTGAGYTSKAVLFDELDLFQKNTESKIAAENVFRKMVNSTATLGNEGKVVSISSLDNVDGMMSKVYYDASKKKNAATFKLCTWEVNPSPNVSEALLREEYKYNMEAFYKYFANRPDISSGLLFPAGVNLNKTMTNVLQCDSFDDCPEVFNFSHAMAVDPGHRNDSFGLSIGYRDGNHIVIDGTMKFEKDGDDAYIKPSDIENTMTSLFESLTITDLIYDIDVILYMVEKAERDYGINTVKHIAGSEAYGLWWKLNEKKDPDFELTVVYDEHLKREAEQLQKGKTEGGRLKIDHPYSGSKDMSDTVANLIWYLYYNDIGSGTNPVITGLSSLSSW